MITRIFTARKDQRFWDNALRNIWTRSAVVTLVAACIVEGIVAWANVARSVRHLAKENSPAATDQTACRIEYSPGNGTPRRGTILFLPKGCEPLTVIGRQVLRPLAQNGWRAISLDLPTYDQEAIAVVAQTVRAIEGPISILAEGSKARVAIGAARLVEVDRRPLLTFIEPIFFSALAECDQSQEVDLLRLRPAIIDPGKWQAFRQDSRIGTRPLVEALDSLAGSSKGDQGGQRFAACAAAASPAQSTENIIK